MKSKTIIISAIEENNTRGILTLFQEEDLLKCRLRVYNLQKISRYCKLGIYHENEVYSANLIDRNGVYESSFAGSFDIDKDFYVALIDTFNDNQVLLAGGTYQGFYFNDNSVFLNSEDFSSISTQKLENVQGKKHQLFDSITQNKQNDCEEDCDKCAKCKYKEFFYNHQSEEDLQKDVKTEKSNIENNKMQEIKIEAKHIEQNKIKDVICSIIPQFDNLFATYEADEQLNALIENSKFVKICENGEQFSIGAIYEEKEIKFICYAIKRDYNINPPEELGQHYQWLPIDSEDPLSVGYYVVFQDASDFKIVEL